MNNPSQLYFNENPPHHYYSNNLPELECQSENKTPTAEFCRSLQHKACPTGVEFASALVQKITELINDASPLVSNYEYTASFSRGAICGELHELMTVATSLLKLGFSVTLDRWCDSWAKNDAESCGYTMKISWVDPSNPQFKETETSH
jgi:hypothetical protein